MGNIFLPITGRPSTRTTFHNQRRREQILRRQILHAQRNLRRHSNENPSNIYYIANEKYEAKYNNKNLFLFGELSLLVNLKNLTTIHLNDKALTKLEKPIKIIQSLIHIRKDTVKLVSEGEMYKLIFNFDSDVPTLVNVHKHATESVTNGELKVKCTNYGILLEKKNYEVGNCLTYESEPITFDSNHIKKPSNNFSRKIVYPIIVEISNKDQKDNVQHHLALITVNFIRNTFMIHCVRQKQVIGKFVYFLSDIYGTEKNSDDDTSQECVICMTEKRDTIILPCRHLCLCEECAEAIRYQSITCPICREPFTTLIRMEIFQEKLDSQIVQ
ncbi:Mahogunin RING finger protein 1 [Intoshia linei]|uniref:Mahogunin RING finger protein 1 n=1 Tax=Intoshia linei TaxID=1819745 RepID=A0A177B150_9BILA|nr:Mahogunin RING finger protein 1 [Intoshia linei]